MPRTTKVGGFLVAVALCLAAPGISPDGAGAASGGGRVNPFIVNGSPISISQVPFQVAVLNLSKSTPRHLLCGGSVVAPKLILTAGHCTYHDLEAGIPESPSNLRVVVNTDDLTSGGSQIAVTAITRHPGYNPAALGNDLALLTLATAAGVAPVSVVPPQSDYRWVTGATAFVSGWGCTVPNWTCDEFANYPAHLRGTSLPVHSDSYCEDEYGPDFDPNMMLCAGNPSSSNSAPGPCFGDSGGPITVPGYQGKRLLIGLVSWGVVCGRDPAVFTRLANYRSWLASKGVSITAPPLTNGVTRQLLPNAQPIVGDFNGDGTADLLAYRSGTASDALYRNVNGGTTAIAVALNGAYHPAVCDVNDDGKDDVILVAPGPGPDYVLFGQAASTPFVSKQIFAINSNYTPVAGDFNGDGKCDLILYQPGAGADHEYVGVGNGTFTPGPSINISGNYAPIVGDFNGDTRSDVIWYAAGTAPDYLRLGKANATFADGATITVNGSYRAVAGDYNNDNRTDVLWYGPGSAIDSLWYAGGSGFTQGPDVSVAGDYRYGTGRFNGDGKDDIAWMNSTGATTLWLAA